MFQTVNEEVKGEGATVAIKPDENVSSKSKLTELHCDSVCILHVRQGLVRLVYSLYD